MAVDRVGAPLEGKGIVPENKGSVPEDNRTGKSKPMRQRREHTNSHSLGLDARAKRVETLLPEPGRGGGGGLSH